jgi:protein-tyrosine-phosphatase
MFARIIKSFRDKHTKILYSSDAVIEFSEERFKEIVSNLPGYIRAEEIINDKDKEPVTDPEGGKTEEYAETKEDTSEQSDSDPEGGNAEGLKPHNRRNK